MDVIIECLGPKKVLGVDYDEKPTLLDYSKDSYYGEVYNPFKDSITRCTNASVHFGPYEGQTAWTINFHDSEFCFTIERQNGPNDLAKYKHVLAYNYRKPTDSWYEKIAPVFTEKLLISTPESYYHNHKTTGYLWSFARPSGDIPAHMADQFPVMIVPYDKTHIYNEVWSRPAGWDEMPRGPKLIDEDRRADWALMNGEFLVEPDRKDPKGVRSIYYGVDDSLRMEALVVTEYAEVPGVTMIKTTRDLDFKKDYISELAPPNAALFKVTSVYDRGLGKKDTPWYDPTSSSS